MADDLGWGDVGYQGNELIRTPHLDRMAQQGLRFATFYAASPVCSPTRASVLTGRSPQRMGIWGAGIGSLDRREITLAEALKRRGYRTGHFGKWHLGAMSREVRDARRGGRTEDTYSPPWLHGFDVTFATESAVPTWDPQDRSPLEEHRGKSLPPARYWTGEGTFATDNLAGDDSRVIMDRVVDFIGDAVARGRPFLAVVWFHAPHEPVVAGPEYRKLYEGRTSEEQADYAGVVTAMDEQVGRLREELERLGVASDTMLWFMSDNGPRRGDSGPFRGGKGSLSEGGLRVPGLLVWPAEVSEGREIAMAWHTDDLYPTVLEAAGVVVDDQPLPVDGISLMPVIEGEMSERPGGMGFETPRELAFVDWPYKIHSPDGGRTFALFDVGSDPAERNDLSVEQPERVRRLAAELESWRTSCARSRQGADYR